MDEIVRVLQSGLAAHPRHAGLAHLYVHAMELSPPKSGGQERALGGALMIRSQWPACGHLLHMPSHLDMQVHVYTHAHTHTYVYMYG